MNNASKGRLSVLPTRSTCGSQTKIGKLDITPRRAWSSACPLPICRPPAVAAPLAQHVPKSGEREMVTADQGTARLSPDSTPGYPVTAPSALKNLTARRLLPLGDLYARSYSTLLKKFAAG